MKSKKDQSKSDSSGTLETYGGDYYFLESTFHPKEKEAPISDQKKEEHPKGKKRRKRQ